MKGMKTISGKGVGREIEPLLRKARKRIWIATPYISKRYVELLLKKAEEGVDVRVITTEKTLKEFRSKKYLVIKLILLGMFLLSTIYPLALIFTIPLFIYLFRKKGALVILLGLVLSVYTSSTIPLSLFSMTYVLIKKGKVKVASMPKTFIHSKLYIIDDVVISGSANLTVSGLWKNYETITIFKENEAKELVSLFKKMWREVSSE